jgi:WD40 repeat protein
LHAANVADSVVFATGDGRFHRVHGEDSEALPGHAGVSLSSCGHPNGFALSGGDDGRVLRVSAKGVEEVAAFGRDWPNAIAVAPQTGLTAISAGKRLHVFDAAFQQVAVFEHPHTVGGVAFDPKGKRVVASHYGGVSVRMAANPDASARVLAWKGSHIAVTWSPCGRFIITSMQENAIHGWRLEDSQHFRMDGYPQRVRSLDWLDRGRKLATTGAGAEVLLWPFVGPKGPMGKAAEALSSPAETDAMILAARPNAATAAVGYRDGSVRLFNLMPPAGFTLEPAAGAAVSALTWTHEDAILAYGREDGTAGLVRVS